MTMHLLSQSWKQGKTFEIYEKEYIPSPPHTHTPRKEKLITIDLETSYLLEILGLFQTAFLS